MPGRAQGYVEFAVPVDGLDGNADVVAFGLFVNDDVLVPRRILPPDSLFFVDGEDVCLAGAVDIAGDDGIADAKVGVELLCLDFELRFPREYES